jgi:hypothetical protein
MPTYLEFSHPRRLAEHMQGPLAQVEAIIGHEHTTGRVGTIWEEGRDKILQPSITCIILKFNLTSNLKFNLGWRCGTQEGGEGGEAVRLGVQHLTHKLWGKGACDPFETRSSRIESR